MIGVALPWVMGGAFAAALGIVGLHFLSVRRPPTLLLPTARFVPERDVRAVSRTAQPSDLLLLVLRVLAVLAAGAAFAGVSWHASAPRVGVVVVADRDVLGDSTTLVRSAQGAAADARAGDAGTSSPVRVARVPRSRVTRDDGVSAAVFALARREAAQLRERGVDSIDLHVLASAPATSDNVAWSAWRSAWPGRVTLHVPPERVADSTRANAAAVTLVRDDSAWRTDDPVRAALLQRGVRADRGQGARDADAVGSRDHVQLEWPVRSAPNGWHAVSDSADALIAGGRVLTGAWRVGAVPDSGVFAADSTLRAIAWWSDGRVAAVESRRAGGCRRVIAASSDASSDLLLSADADALMRVLTASCLAMQTVDAAALTRRVVDGAALASVRSLETQDTAFAGGAARDPSASWLTIALLALAVALLLVEWRLRDRDGDRPREPFASRNVSQNASQNASQTATASR